jgi:Na+-driven multidrug efflux pump
MTRVKFLKFWSIAVGSMDTLTGLMLLADPAGVLRLLRIAPPSPDALVFLSWIGIFVMAVGLSYGLALNKRGRGEAVWMFTSGVRMLVAVFLTFRILDHSLEKPWILVAVADATVAIVQIAILRAGWWKEVPL